jgi:predicted Zn-dependent protease
VFGRFFDESHNPKRALFFEAVKAVAAGKTEEARAFFDRAAATEDPPPEDVLYFMTVHLSRRWMNAEIELARARLLLDQGKDDEADTALGKAGRLLDDTDELKLLESRLAVRRGSYDKAFRQLRKGMEDGDLGGEGFALMAVAAHASGHTEEYGKALKKARENGVDVAALTAAP